MDGTVRDAALQTSIARLGLPGVESGLFHQRELKTWVVGQLGSFQPRHDAWASGGAERWTDGTGWLVVCGL